MNSGRFHGIVAGDIKTGGFYSYRVISAYNSISFWRHQTRVSFIWQGSFKDCLLLFWCYIHHFIFHYVPHLPFYIAVIHHLPLKSVFKGAKTDFFMLFFFFFFGHSICRKFVLHLFS
ncbi:hypothetical protein BDZ91DRAFT_318701 [Kalaharituber pfeilii]|nr:hypothetical protein BDZ91DRAFT_318701 [Kalaharituber pfeilii]